MPKIALGKGGAKGKLQVLSNEHKTLAGAASLAQSIVGASDSVEGGEELKPVANAALKAIADLTTALAK